MSELLRAVLDRQCVDSRCAFYTLHLHQAQAPQARIQQQISLQGKTDVWFLCMTYSLFSTSYQPAGAVGGNADTFTSGAEVQMLDGKTFRALSVSQGAFQNQLLPAGALNGALNNSYALPEYILFEPRQLITATIGVVAMPTIVRDVFLTLAGIEYRFPSGVPS